MSRPEPPESSRPQELPTDGRATVPVAWPVRVFAVWPARAVAFAVFLPLRLLYELVALVLRWLLRATWEWLLYPVLRLLCKTLSLLTRALSAILSAVWDWVLCPGGRALAWLWSRACLPVLRGARLVLGWLAVTTGNWLRALSRAAGLVAYYLGVRPGRWLTRVALRPAWCATAWVLVQGWGGAWAGLRLSARLLAFLTWHLLVRPSRWLTRVVLAPLGLGLRWALAEVWRGALACLRLLARLAASLLWHLVARPGRCLTRVVIVPGWRGTVAVLGWAGRATRFVLRLLAAPARWCWRAVAVPTARAVAAALELSVIRPSRWLRHTVWTPIRLAASDVARALTGRPARAAKQAKRL